MKTLLFWTKQVVIWWLFNYDLRLREQEQEEKEPQIPRLNHQQKVGCLTCLNLTNYLILSKLKATTAFYERHFVYCAVLQSRQQALRAYCPNIYTVIIAKGKWVTGLPEIIDRAGWHVIKYNHSMIFTQRSWTGFLSSGIVENFRHPRNWSYMFDSLRQYLKKSQIVIYNLIFLNI